MDSHINGLDGNRVSFVSSPSNTQFSPAWTSTGKPTSEVEFDVDPDLLEAASMDIDDGDDGGDHHDAEIAMLERVESSAAFQIVGGLARAQPSGHDPGSPSRSLRHALDKCSALERENADLKRAQLAKDGEIRLLRDRQMEQERARSEQAVAVRVAEDSHRQQQTEIEHRLKEEVEKLSTQLSFQSHENRELRKRLEDVQRVPKEKPGDAGQEDARGEGGDSKPEAFSVTAGFSSGFSVRKRSRCTDVDSESRQPNSFLSSKRVDQGERRREHPGSSLASPRKFLDLLSGVPLREYCGPLLLKELLSGDQCAVQGIPLGSSSTPNLFSLLRHTPPSQSDMPSSIEKHSASSPPQAASLRKPKLHLPDKASGFSKRGSFVMDDHSSAGNLPATLRSLLADGFHASTPLSSCFHEGYRSSRGTDASAAELFTQLASIALQHCKAFQDSLQSLSAAEHSFSCTPHELATPECALDTAQLEARNLALTAFSVIKRLLECSPSTCQQLAVVSSQTPQLRLPADGEQQLDSSDRSSSGSSVSPSHLFSAKGASSSMKVSFFW